MWKHRAKLSFLFRNQHSSQCCPQGGKGRSHSWGDLGAQVPAISVSVRFPNTFVDLAKRV